MFFFFLGFDLDSMQAEGARLIQLLVYQAAWEKCARRESSYAAYWVVVDERVWTPSSLGSRCCDLICAGIFFESRFEMGF